jgi:hypothetical protein
MSWKPEVIADSSGKWSGNRLRFATKLEAEGNVRNLAIRWTLVTDIRVVEVADPVNATWDLLAGLTMIQWPGDPSPAMAPANRVTAADSLASYAANVSADLDRSGSAPFINDREREIINAAWAVGRRSDSCSQDIAKRRALATTSKDC